MAPVATGVMPFGISPSEFLSFSWRWMVAVWLLVVLQWSEPEAGGGAAAMIPQIKLSTGCADGSGSAPSLCFSHRGDGGGERWGDVFCRFAWQGSQAAFQVNLSDLVTLCPAASLFNEGLKFCGWSSSKDAALVGSYATCAKQWCSSFCAWRLVGINVAAASSNFHGVDNWCVLAGLMAYSYVEEDGADSEMILGSVPSKVCVLLLLRPDVFSMVTIHSKELKKRGMDLIDISGEGVCAPLIQVIELPSLPGALLLCSALQPSMVLQLTLHMREGIPAPVPHCSTRFDTATRGLCWADCDVHKLKGVLDADTWFLLCIFYQILEIASTRKNISCCYMKYRSQDHFWFLWYVFDQISESNSSCKNIFKCCMQTHVLLQHLGWWRPRACRSVSISSYSELHSYSSGCGTLYPLQATVHEYAFLPFGIRRRRLRASLLRILIFNGQDPPGLSSVMAHLDLQLIPLPQRHLTT